MSFRQDALRNNALRRDGSFNTLKSSVINRLPLANANDPVPSTPTNLIAQYPPGGYEEGSLIYNANNNTPYIRTTDGGIATWSILGGGGGGGGESLFQTLAIGNFTGANAVSGNPTYIEVSPDDRINGTAGYLGVSDTTPIATFVVDSMGNTIQFSGASLISTDTNTMQAQVNGSFLYGGIGDGINSPGAAGCIGGISPPNGTSGNIFIVSGPDGVPGMASGSTGDVTCVTSSVSTGNTSGSSGNMAINTGDVFDTASTGGVGGVFISTGNNEGTGGISDLVLLSGDVTGAGNINNGGNIQILTGDSVDGNGGDLSVICGDSANSIGGAINITGGNGTAMGGTGNGRVVINSGNGVGNNGWGGEIDIGGGTGDQVGNGGTINIASGDSPDGSGGNLNLVAGNSSNAMSGGTGGLVDVGAGNASGNGNGGSTTIRGGNSNDGTGGDVNINAGINVNNVQSGGKIIMTGGAGANGGSVSITAGSSDGANNGPTSSLIGGDTFSGTPGSVSISIGTDQFNVGRSLTLEGSATGNFLFSSQGNNGGGNYATHLQVRQAGIPAVVLDPAIISFSTNTDSSDTCGSVELTAGGGGVSPGGAMFTLTYSNAFSNSTFVILTEVKSAGTAVGPYLTSSSNSNFVVATENGLPASETVVINWHVFSGTL